MDARQYLEDLKYILVDIKSRQDELAEIENNLIHTPKLKEINVQESRVNSAEDSMMRILELREEISLKVAELVAKKKEANDYIERLRVPLERLVLRKRYINNQSLIAISRDLNKNVRYLGRVHDSGVEKIQEMLDKKIS